MAPDFDKCLACPVALNGDCPTRVTPDMAACEALRRDWKERQE